MKDIPLLIFGAGGVGRALIQQLLDGREIFARRNQIQFKIVGVADSRSARWSIDGLSEEQLREIIRLKKKRKRLGEEQPTTTALLQTILDAGIKNGIIVDVTAADGMEPLLNLALDNKWGVALANKKALAAPLSSARRYYNHPNLRHESTVGGGQPIIAAIRYLLDAGDTIEAVSGQLSGSIGFICRQLEEGIPFSQAVVVAKAKGFTEPDPRDDLGGRDVMRKMLILARLAGWELEEKDIQVESLYPAALSHLPPHEFLAASISLDPRMKDKMDAAAASGETLRYVAEVSSAGGSVSLKSVPADSATANLKYITVQSKLYQDEPLLIAGKGAGVAMTAAGVLGDIINLAREMK